MIASRRRAGVVKGCLIALGVFFVLIVAACIVVAVYWRQAAAGASIAATEAVLKESTLPQDQKDQIMAEVRALGADIEAGKVTPTQFARVFDEIRLSPLLPLAGIEAARQKFIEPAEMTPEEKEDAHLTLQRFARGVHEGTIAPAEQQITDTLKPVIDLKASGTWEFKDTATRQEVDQFIANAEAKADAAGVLNEPYNLDIAQELRRAIDRALGRPASSPSALPPPTPPGGP